MKIALRVVWTMLPVCGWLSVAYRVASGTGTKADDYFAVLAIILIIVFLLCSDIERWRKNK